MCLSTHRRLEGPGPGFLAPASCAQRATDSKRIPLGWPGPWFSFFHDDCLPVPLSNT